MAPANSCLVQSKISTEMTLSPRDEPGERAPKRKREDHPRDAKLKTQLNPSAYILPPLLSSCPTEEIIPSDAPTDPAMHSLAQGPVLDIPSSPPPLTPIPKRVATRVARAPSITCQPPSDIGLLDSENMDQILGSGCQPTTPPAEGHEQPTRSAAGAVTAAALAFQDRLQSRTEARKKIIQALTQGIITSLKDVQYLDPRFAQAAEHAAVRFFNNFCQMSITPRDVSPPRSYAEAAKRTAMPPPSGRAGAPRSSRAVPSHGRDAGRSRGGQAESTPRNQAEASQSNQAGPSRSSQAASASASAQSDQAAPALRNPRDKRADSRLFIRAAAGSKAAVAGKWAIREQLGDLKDLVQAVQCVPSGFALIPKSAAAAQQLQDQAEAISTRLDCPVEAAQQWHSYILREVPTCLRSFDGSELLVCEARLAEEAAAVTGMKPLRVSWSKHSDPSLFEREVILAFGEEVKPFSLFESRRSRPLIRKATVLQCAKCHGYHDTRSCRSAPCCSRCSQTGHEAASCSALTPTCRSCGDAHDTRDHSCTLRPKVVGQHIIHPTRKQRFDTRKAIATIPRVPAPSRGQDKAAAPREEPW